jgi:Mn2+/Fe2+ NRAMP family transporter
VFTRPNGDPMAPDWLSRYFRQLSDATGLPPIRLHDLRHGAASLALAPGADLKVVQDMLGHSSIVLSADTYISVLPEVARETDPRAVRLPVGASLCGHAFASAVGALLTEFAGIAGVGELFGIPKTVTVPVATLFLIGLAMTGSYGRVERIGIAVGLAELAFFVAVVMSHPRIGAVARGLGSLPLTNSSYVLLVAANVGAVIMPWMIFYQQGAVIDKKLSPAAIRQARQDTAVGSVLTQLIMIAVVIAVAATLGLHHPDAALSTVGQISGALTPYLGHFGGVILFGLGMLGAAMVAAIVSSVAGAGGLADVFGWKHTLNERPSRQTAKFYITYCLAHVAGAALVLASVNMIRLSVDVMIMNAMLLPIVLGFLLALEARALPARWRMRGTRRYLTWTMCLLVMGFGLYMIPATLHWA